MQTISEKPNKTVIEMTSVSKVKDAVLRTGVVEPDIRENDKTPSWDGELRLYKSQESFSKDSLIGNIPVQVKGTWVNRFSKNKATFQVEVSDLRNYLQGGGVMFFLVQIKDFDCYKIYFASLLPFDLRRLLDEAKDQNTKQIKLEQFPYKYRDGVLRILTRFITNKRKQGTLLPNIRSMLDLNGAEIEIEQLEFSVPSVGLKTPEAVFEDMLQNPLYIYAKPKNLEASFVVDKIFPEEIITHHTSSVEVNGEVLYDRVDFIRKAGGIKQIKIADSFLFTIHEGHLSFNYNFNGTLNEQIQSLTLLDALVQGKKVKIGKQEMPFSNLTLNGHTPEEITRRLSMLRRAKEVLLQLRVKKDLEFGRTPEEDLQKLSFLAAGVLDKTPVPISINGKGGVGLLRIGNIDLLLSLKKYTHNEFIVSNFFDTRDIVLTKDKNTPKNGVPVSPYIMLNVDLLDSVDNLNLDEIAPSIMSYPYWDAYGNKIILLVLELLKLYDKKRNDDILDIVTQLLSFIKENDCGMEELCKINQLQTEKRRRRLTKEEIRYLVSLKQSGISLPYQLAANILLESFSEAQLVYDQLEEQERKEFDCYPIKNLWPSN